MGDDMMDTDATAGGTTITALLTAADHAQVDAAVAFLNTALCESGVRLATTVSDFVIAQFFGGDVSQLDSRDSTKSASYNALAERPDLQMGASTLRRLVRVGLQVRQMPQELAAALTQGQHRALLVVEDTAHKVELATTAVAEHWTAEKLSEVIALEHQKERPKAGRPPKPPIVKVVASIGRAISSAGSARDCGVAISALSATDRAALLVEISASINQLRAILSAADNQNELQPENGEVTRPAAPTAL